MSAPEDKPPVPWKQLFDSLFQERNDQETIHIISAGLIAILNNANRLMADVTLLAEAERYSTATFLLTTADEEMAKSYILIDMCRLDFQTYQSVLRRLCQAFYNHI